ncbi:MULTISPECIES: hypothetical protein [Enterobacter]|uniref:Uncharacterized protein n=1 Tax=Enterobacter pseudoroggenkampii TaxID=2996112 RepID=A0ABT3XIX2_9ENTR|nr:MULTISPECIES: hypothetical protein [Enterobacter]MBT2052303.1 hypothetical protein [Enterobacter asburiae]MCX8305745.1 hypothetical protein [Enterobacter pseudoroggenkampii]RJK98622.1 hypothetical protein D5066_22755 [Enterobacter chuandaensis]
MHTQKVNVKTAAPESSRKIGGKTQTESSGFVMETIGQSETVSALTFEQFWDLYSWVVSESQADVKPVNFVAPADSVELIYIDPEVPDYFSVWLLDGYPVAAAALLENFSRVLPSFVKIFAGDKS